MAAASITAPTNAAAHLVTTLSPFWTLGVRVDAGSCGASMSPEAPSSFAKKNSSSMKLALHGVVATTGAGVGTKAEIMFKAGIVSATTSSFSAFTGEIDAISTTASSCSAFTGGTDAAAVIERESDVMMCSRSNVHI